MNTIAQTAPTPQPWWRFRMAWLAFGLPAAAVVAATLSAVIAVRHADVVVDDHGARTRMAAETSAEQGGRADPTEPAERARNHASMRSR